MHAFSTLQAHIGCHVLAETVEGEGDSNSVVYLRKALIMYTSMGRLCSCIHLLKNIYIYVSQIQYSLWNVFFLLFCFVGVRVSFLTISWYVFPNFPESYFIKTVISRVIFQEPCSVVSLREYEYDCQVSNHNEHDYTWICAYGCTVKSVRSD